MNSRRVGEEETRVSAKHLLRRFDSGTRLPLQEGGQDGNARVLKTRERKL